MDITERRGLLKCQGNPDKAIDYVISLGGMVACPKQGYDIQLRYIPDRDILDHAAFTIYLGTLGMTVWNTPEDLAVTILSDVNNQVVARWVQLTLTTQEPKNSANGSPISSHCVTIEDRQPGWNNANLLGRLARI